MFYQATADEIRGCFLTHGVVWVLGSRCHAAGQDFVLDFMTPKSPVMTKTDESDLSLRHTSARHVFRQMFKNSGNSTDCTVAMLRKKEIGLCYANKQTSLFRGSPVP